MNFEEDYKMIALILILVIIIVMFLYRFNLNDKIYVSQNQYNTLSDSYFTCLNNLEQLEEKCNCSIEAPK